ncbi:MAG: N-formylglutamate amidohydrolase [Gemmatimonadaceae bacterium]
MPIPSVVLHIPHSSTIVPDDVRGRIVLSDEALALELLAMTDHFTDELFARPSDAARVVYPVSRLVVDPERFDDDSQEVMVSRGMGAIYTRTSAGAALRNEPDAAARAELLTRYYRPHHAALMSAVRESLRDNGRSLVVDCHSFPSAPLPYELDQRAERPDICVGTDSFHTPNSLTDEVCGLFRAKGFTIDVNRPFGGSIVPITFYRTDARVSSIMIEVNRGLYMNEVTGERSAQFGAVADIVTSVLEQLGLGRS